ncbi:MAG: hypothetical protein WBA74_02925 [Cyclobacteriaceae bacterium]
MNKNCKERPPVPTGALAPTPNALLEFDGYYWWTNYPFNISPGQGYWFNNQQWDPRLATVDSEGLHLQMKQTEIPGAPSAQWSSIELVLWGETKNNPNRPGLIPKRSYPGYGKYLVAATTTESFNGLANNCCFGAFTYQFEKDGTITNGHRELDMMECSRFGNFIQASNGQFTLQPWNDNPNNVHRIEIDKLATDITIVMDWKAQSTPVVFQLFYGIHDWDSLPDSPDIQWTTSSDQNIFIPDEGCQTIHLNLWRQPQSIYPSGNQEVTIKKFSYRAAQ